MLANLSTFLQVMTEHPVVSVLLVLGSVLLLIALFPLFKFLKNKYLGYIKQRLFFEPWRNLSTDEKLNIGTSLAEILLFEVEALRDVHERASSYEGIWNQISALPLFEQTLDGQPKFLKQVELLGLTGKLEKLLRVILFIIFQVPPTTIRGSIHKFGDLIRLQVTLDGLRDEEGNVQRTRCWTRETTAETAAETAAVRPEQIPEMVSMLAHNIYLELSCRDHFKSTESFSYYTEALRNHLAFTSLKKVDHQKEAIRLYEEAIKADGGNNDIASLNIAELLYLEYKNLANEKAIKYYQGSLRTTNNLLRAQAYRGLANAYCQRFQRHNQKDPATLMEALRYAQYAYEIYEKSGVPKNADVVKALAYATQLQAKRDGVAQDEVENIRKRAVELYQEAIHLNNKFTIAYNNLGYIYLFVAERENEKSDRKDQSIIDENLKKAEHCFKKAIESDSAYPLPYDNLGNAYFLMGDLDAAEKHYLEALDYYPDYVEAFEDLTTIHLCFAHAWATIDHKKPDKPLPKRLRERQYHNHKAWEFHEEALKRVKGDIQKSENICDKFKRRREEYGQTDPEITLPDAVTIVLSEAGCACAIQLGNAPAKNVESST